MKAETTSMRRFISEDDLDTFDGWLKYQAIDAATLTPEELAMWRGYFEEATQGSAATPKVGLMKLRPIPGEYRYAVALREGSGLWLTLWIRRSPKGEFFVMVPRGDREWDPHNSYHLDGTFHSKSFNKRLGDARKRQPLTGTFRGTEHLGGFYGHGPKRVGAVCDPAAFNGVVEVPPGVLGPSHGSVVVDLVEPNHEPLEWPFTGPIRTEVFRDFVPWVVIRIGSS
jgi:hypothetical protein